MARQKDRKPDYPDAQPEYCLITGMDIRFWR